MKKHYIFLLYRGYKKIKLDFFLKKISQNIGKIIRKSSYFNVRKVEKNTYIVLYLTTCLSPYILFKKILYIEYFMKNILVNYNIKNSIKYKNINIYILFYDDIIIYSPLLKIPYPLIHLRRFMLEPMCEISPEKNHPIFNKTMLEILGTFSYNS